MQIYCITENISYTINMCFMCGMGLPVCTVDGSCSSMLVQNAKTALVLAGPMVGGGIVWINNKRKRSEKKGKKENK